MMNGIIKNVVIVNDFDYVQGGASKIAIETANLLKKEEKLNVYFFSGSHDSTSTLRNDIKKVCTHQGEALKDMNKIRGFFNGIYNFKAKHKFKKLLNSLDKENTIIHVHGWTKCLSSSVFDVIFKKKFKMVLTLHDYFIACPNGGYFNYKKDKICHLKPLSLKCATCNCDSRNYLYKLYRILRQFVQSKIVGLNSKLKNVITISNLSEKILQDNLNKSLKIFRIYNPIDPMITENKIDYSQNHYYLYVGRVTKEKGVDVFCQAITTLNLNGIVVGDGPLLNTLKNKYTNIIFTGWKSKDNVTKYMKNSKALIFPSKWYETAGLTILEAEQIGIPVFVSDCTAGIEFCTGKNCDLIFDPNDVSDLVNKIKMFEANPSTEYGKSSLEMYYKYIQKNYIREIKKCYGEVIGDK